MASDAATPSKGFRPLFAEAKLPRFLFLRIHTIYYNHQRRFRLHWHWTEDAEGVMHNDSFGQSVEWLQEQSTQGRFLKSHAPAAIEDDPSITLEQADDEMERLGCALAHYLRTHSGVAIKLSTFVVRTMHGRPTLRYHLRFGYRMSDGSTVFPDLGGRAPAAIAREWLPPTPRPANLVERFSDQDTIDVTLARAEEQRVIDEEKKRLFARQHSKDHYALHGGTIKAKAKMRRAGAPVLTPTKMARGLTLDEYNDRMEGLEEAQRRREAKREAEAKEYTELYAFAAGQKERQPTNPEVVAFYEKTFVADESMEARWKAQDAKHDWLVADLRRRRAIGEAYEKAKNI